MRLTRIFVGLVVTIPCLAAACGESTSDTPNGGAGADAGGQSGDDGGGSTVVACRSDKTCTPFGQLCDTNLSICVECITADDCEDNARCDDGTCKEVTPCDSSKDCSTAEVCDETLGYCVECVGDNDCGDGQLCANSTCHDTCDSSKDCSANDQVCGDAGYCVECSGNNDCDDGSFCRANLCVPTVCDDGSTSCADDDLLSCKADGSGFDAETCANGCEEADGVAACEEPSPGQCAGNTADPCASIPEFTGTQTVDGDPEDFCDIPYTTLNVQNAGLVGGPTGSPISASTIDSDSEARIKVAWSADALHVHIHVVDPVIRVVETSGSEYNGDNVQLFIQGAEPAGGSKLSSGSTANVVSADVASEPQQLFLVPEAGSFAGSSRHTVPWGSTTGYEWATRATVDGYDIEVSYPWPAAVAPMTADRVIGFDFMVGVNDDAAPSSTRQFEYGLYLGDVASSACSPSYDALWCDNAHWCKPTTAN